ncbi:class II aldolase/adducin family protein [Butyrivibrio sp. VCD2006]|uniref:class II aldolase/adducin family protein n=1 Tax=Butyrivibrio sp. VCD2006 TaxID=1280664 RepID=UPI0003F52067|nr:class II aldolase/adducin family protein [Butyrivibrio sp. VCD2006]
MKTKEEIQKLREEIIDVSLSLLESGLIVRTWGNISAKIDDKHYLITPSGIRYEDLKPDMLPLVSIEDGSYEGEYKPSSEFMVHTAIYKTRNDAEFIVHTHQVYATCVGALGKKRLKAEHKEKKIIFPVADYALPGTKALADNVKSAAAKNSETRSIIMANHGAVCFGHNAEEAVKEAIKLEKAAKKYIFNICKTDASNEILEGFSSKLEEGKIVYLRNDTPERVKLIHQTIYAKRPDVHCIFHNKSEAVMTISRRVNHMRPLLDDFAQIIGTSVRIPTAEGAPLVVKKKINTVFAYNDGAYCLGDTEEDAKSAAIVLDKGCIAHLAVTRFGEGRFISLKDCFKMNRNYRKNYSVLAKSVK